MSRRPTHDRSGGFALVLVVGLVAAVSVLSLAFIGTSATNTSCSANLVNASRARYVAECGVAHACYWLSHPKQSMVNSDGYWSGATGQRIDADTLDCYDVSVSRKAGTDDTYIITSTGRRISGAGASVAHKATVVVTVSKDPRVLLPNALHASGDGTLGPPAQITGDVFVHGSVLSLASIDGELDATGTALCLVWPAGGAQSNQPAQHFPGLAVSHYVNYTLAGRAYQAATVTRKTLTDMDDLDPSGKRRDTWNISDTNPGGVVRLPKASGNSMPVLDDGFVMEGTLAVEDDLEIDGDNVVITAQDGFPALVIAGDLVLSGKNRRITVNGAVIISGTIRNGNNISGTRLTINGPVYVGDGLSVPSQMNRLRIISDAAAWLYDFTVPVKDRRYGEITVQSWTD